MRRDFISIVLGLIAVLTVLIFYPGCKEEAKGKDTDPVKNRRELKVGYIDSDQLLFEFPEFKKFYEKKQKGRLDIQERIRKSIPNRKLSDEDKKYIEDLTKDFAEKEASILKKFVEQVREASIKVMEEKKIDIIINNASNSVIEYGGEDITSEVQAKMVEIRKRAESLKQPSKEKEKK